MPVFERASSSIATIKADAVVIGARSDGKLTKQGAQLDKALDGGLSEHLKKTRFKANLGDSAIIPTFGRVPAGLVIVVGLGSERPTHDEVRRAAGTAARLTSAYPSVVVDLADGVSGGSQAVVEGLKLGAYEFNRYKSKAEASRNERITLAGKAEQADIERGEAIADAVNWARDIVNEPAGARGPAGFAALAKTRAEAAGLSVEILDEKALAKNGMEGILRVGQGSASPPRFLIIRYAPRGAKGHVGIIGKGITFDSGGLSLKPAEGMETMKTDCSGAAAVVAAITALGELKPKIKVTAAVPLAENMPGGKAVKPGDVIRHYGGRTSEVLNTDAEGRLVLADALAWMAQKKPDAMVDLATLTGGMVIALGRKVAGFFSNDDRLAQEIEDSAARSGERVWEMPLIDDLRKEIDSDVADIKNTGGRWGSPIFGALFLRDFVGDIPWAHLDIAGPARSERNEFHINKGATGVGTRLLINWIENRAGH